MCTWRPLQQINLTHLGLVDGAELSSALSKDAPSTTIMVEGRHDQEPPKTRHMRDIKKYEDPDAGK